MLQGLLWGYTERGLVLQHLLKQIYAFLAQDLELLGLKVDLLIVYSPLYDILAFEEFFPENHLVKQQPETEDITIFPFVIKVLVALDQLWR